MEVEGGRGLGLEGVGISPLSHLNCMWPGPKATAFPGLSFLNLKMPVKLMSVKRVAQPLGRDWCSEVATVFVTARWDNTG